MKKVSLLLIFIICLLSSDEEFKNIKNSYFKSYDYEQVGRYKEAIKILAPLSKEYPKGYTLSLRLAWLFYLQKQYNTSLRYYTEASLLDTKSLEPKIGLIRVYLATYSFEKAQNVATEILKVDYYNYYTNLYMAKALNAQKKYEIAITVSEKMLQIYPTDTLFLEQLFLSYKATNNKHYKDIYESILILDPNNVIVRTRK